jgi:lysophospholipase-3
VTLNFRAPLVPVTSVNGVGVPTVDKVVYWDGNFTETPRVVNGDGVGIVNLETVLALQRLVGDDPDQQYFKSVLIPNMTHNGMILDELGLRSVVKEILEANRATSF